MKLNKEQKSLLKFFKKCYRKSDDPLDKSVYDDCIKLHNNVCGALMNNEFIIPIENIKVENDFSFIDITTMSDEDREEENAKGLKKFHQVLKKKIAFYQKVISIYNSEAKKLGYSYKLELNQSKEEYFKRNNTYIISGITKSYTFMYWYQTKLYVSISIIDKPEDIDLSESQIKTEDLF